jgi:acetyl-CoA synthetase
MMTAAERGWLRSTHDAGRRASVEEAARMNDRPGLITPDPKSWAVRPNLGDWAEERARFRWESLRSELYGDASGSANMSVLALDRHLAAGRGARTALRCVSEDGAVRTVSYEELAEQSRRFANVLAGLGLGAGARVFILTGRRAELYPAVLGALRAEAVVCSLFAAFGPEPLRTRLEIGAAEVLVTTVSLYRRKIAPLRAALPKLRHVILVDAPAADPVDPSLLSWPTLMSAASDRHEAPPTAADTPALLHFTSGTTGTPKGALHVHEAALMHYMTGRYALDLHGDDVFWCTADPGWVTGMSYGVLAPLLHGVTCIVDAGEFDAERWYRLLESQRVSVWYTAPTALRLLIKAGRALADRHSRPALRLVASVGEPLNAEAVWWGVDVLGLPIHDNWWQTETGGIVVANTPSQPIKPGSMGRPLPGIDVAVVERRPDGSLAVESTGEATGELALRRGWPSMFRGYLGQPERYAKCFSGDWYLSGDLVRRDADGYLWFLGRTDDVIKTSGHLVGPFEIESVLMEHPAVVEAAVIGLPDPMAGEVIKGYVVLRQGFSAGTALRDEIVAHARRRLGPSLAPRDLAFADSLPHTRSGKIMRRLLRARELGLPEGDTSALEAPA